MTVCVRKDDENIDTLRALRGRDYKVADNITIRQPTIGEIEEFGEQRYTNLLTPFICTPFDMIAQLDKAGIDFTQITNYQLFAAMLPTILQNESKILFGDTDFTKYYQTETKNGFELVYNDSIISESVYNAISDYLRKINNLAPPQYKKVGNEYTKQKMIEYAYDDLQLAKRKKYKSTLSTLISRATNHPYFKYKLDEVWNMKVFAFYDALNSIHIIEHSNHLYAGAYSGCLDFSKINKKDFNWLRESD